MLLLKVALYNIKKTLFKGLNIRCKTLMGSQGCKKACSSKGLINFI